MFHYTNPKILTKRTGQSNCNSTFLLSDVPDEVWLHVHAQQAQVRRPPLSRRATGLHPALPGETSWQARVTLVKSGVRRAGADGAAGRGHRGLDEETEVRGEGCHRQKLPWQSYQEIRPTG